jgi:PadR family transcriptional regulator, regulatory protein PadR
MKKPGRQLGDFERAVLLAVASLGDDAYGVGIHETLEDALERDVSFGAVYTTLDRLLEKGMLSTRIGESTPQRGGRAKKHFRIEQKGMEALKRAKEASEALWSLIPAGGER